MTEKHRKKKNEDKKKTQENTSLAHFSVSTGDAKSFYHFTEARRHFFFSFHSLFTLRDRISFQNKCARLAKRVLTQTWHSTCNSQRQNSNAKKDKREAWRSENERRKILSIDSCVCEADVCIDEDQALSSAYFAFNAGNAFQFLQQLQHFVTAEKEKLESHAKLEWRTVSDACVSFTPY